MRLDLAYLRRLRTPALVVLLLFVETLLGSRFKCPRDRVRAIIYSLLYLFLPAVFIGVSKRLLRPRRVVAASPRQAPPVIHVVWVIIQNVEAPLIWVWIVLLNEKFYVCLACDGESICEDIVFFALQIGGLVFLVLTVTLEYCLPRVPSLQKHLQYRNHLRQEELIRQEIESSIQEAADERGKAYVRSLISPDLEKLHPEDPKMQDEILQIIQQCQQKAGVGSAGVGLLIKEAEMQQPLQVPV
ncbi:uncharacterized protein [Engystomops pustulosus]|uniref:uncharacterized protein n=1 Tax=Engystomops pustulosus TaxID=76066 RepID=UPI003AFB0156